MKFWVLVAAASLLSLNAWGKEASGKARAELKNAQGQNVGTATFTPAKQGVAITLNIQNLLPGVHGIHIHEAGKCDAPDFKTAGGHFNPTGKHHGSLNPQGEHAGDLGNLTVAPKGTAKVKLTAKGVTLGEGENSLFHPGGTSLVIHGNPDDLKTDPAGNAGPRIVCGVITKQ
jgi:Cu-Zn family superoxide dismutase